MPIEIRELHIRVAVNPPAAGPRPAGGSTAPAGGEENEELLAECVEQVLQVINDKNER